MTMGQESPRYELQLSRGRDALWIHSSDGSTVGRFGRLGIDLHNTVTEQLAGQPECRLCTHGKPTTAEWVLFRELAFQWWGVDVPTNAFSPALPCPAGHRRHAHLIYERNMQSRRKTEFYARQAVMDRYLSTGPSAMAQCGD